MNIEQRISELLRKLVLLGYYPFQLKHIIQEALGSMDMENANEMQRIQIVNVLEKYEKLGREYLMEYSK